MTRHFGRENVSVERFSIYEFIRLETNGRQVVSLSLGVSLRCCTSVCLLSGKEALCKRLGRETILMVSSTTAVGGTLRCVTLAAQDNLALEKWTAFLEKVA